VAEKKFCPEGGKEGRKEGRKQSEKTTTVGASFRKLRHVRDESVRMGQT
jgi:hypothetical protein